MTSWLLRISQEFKRTNMLRINKILRRKKRRGALDCRKVWKFNTLKMCINDLDCNNVWCVATRRSCWSNPSFFVLSLTRLGSRFPLPPLRGNYVTTVTKSIVKVTQYYFIQTHTTQTLLQNIHGLEKNCANFCNWMCD